MGETTRKTTPQERYCKDKTISINVRFTKSTEADLIGHMGKQRNKAGYIKDLIYADMVKKEEERTKNERSCTKDV